MGQATKCCDLVKKVIPQKIDRKFSCFSSYTKSVLINSYIFQEIHQMGIQSLAELTACSVESFHKAAQLLQVNQSAPINSYKFRASNLKMYVHNRSRYVKIIISIINFVVKHRCVEKYFGHN